MSAPPAPSFGSAETRSAGTTPAQLSVNGTVFTVPSGFIAVLTSLLLTNTTNGTIQVTAYNLRNGTPVNMIVNLTLLTGSSEDLIDNKIVLLPGDAIFVSSTVAASLDALMSYTLIPQS